MCRRRRFGMQRAAANAGLKCGSTSCMAGLLGLALCVRPASAAHEATPARALSGSSSVVFYHPDHLGSANILTDETGALTAEVVYYPFGGVRHEHREAHPIAPRYGFGDKERDSESGLHYFDARYLSDRVGRFITPDPYFSEDMDAAIAVPQRFNLYAYVRNNPVAFADPSGLQDVPLYSAGADSSGYTQGASEAVKLVFAGLAHTAVEALGGANTANAPTSASAPRQDTQATGEVVFRVAVNAGFGTLLKQIARGIVAIEGFHSAAPAVVKPPSSLPASPNEWVPAEIGKPIPGVKPPPITDPRLAAALNSYKPSTPAQQLASQGQRLLAEHMVLGANRPGTTVLNMAQAGQRAQVGQLHQFFVAQHQHAIQAAAQQGANKQMLDSRKNLADMTVPLSGK